MPTTPTYDEFIARFPIFGDKDQTQVESLLAEAANQIDSDWRDPDYQPAIMYLTAHYLAIDNSGLGEDVNIGGPAIVQSESFGGMSTTYSRLGGASGSMTSNLYSTVYGQRFADLASKNKPGIVAV